MKPLSAQQVADAHGFTARHWIRLAAAGRIPGVCQPTGPKGRWMFDARVFKTWWDGQQRRVEQWPGYTREAKRGGDAPSVAIENTVAASKQRIRALLKSVSANGSRS